MYAVKLYSEVSINDKPIGIPDGWIAELVDISDAQELPEWCDGSWILMTPQEVENQRAANQSAYDDWQASYKSTPASEILKRKILNAMEFGRNLIAEYGAQNILAGLTMSQIQDIMNKTNKVQIALNTGSLYVALTELAQVQTDPDVITPERIAEFRHKIQDYLGIPRT